MARDPLGSGARECLLHPQGGGKSAFATGRRLVTALALAWLACWGLPADRACARGSSFDPHGKPLHVELSDSWDRIELLEDTSPVFAAKEPYPACAKHVDQEIVAAFMGDQTPPSNRFLLHLAHGWDRKGDPCPPVLLVHGAVVDATKSWGTRSFKGRGGEGLAARLAAAGRRVFAITFAQPHGDNWLQSELLADAIARVRALTGASKVDLAAHSKGGIVARLYCEDLRLEGMTRYRNDVRRLLLLGAPNAGIDVSFAYPNLGYWVIVNHASAPLVWTDALLYGVWKDMKADSIYAPPDGGGAFLGQAQMLARWDGVYGLSRDERQLDVKTTYEGGRGSVTRSLGIDKAMADGGGLVDRLQKAGVDPRIEVALLAGSKCCIMGFVGERRGPSDGLLFVRSALSQGGITRRGAKVIRSDVLHLSHIELAYADQAVDWIESTLAR